MGKAAMTEHILSLRYDYRLVANISPDGGVVIEKRDEKDNSTLRSMDLDQDESRALKKILDEKLA